MKIPYILVGRSKMVGFSCNPTHTYLSKPHFIQWSFFPSKYVQGCRVSLNVLECRLESVRANEHPRKLEMLLDDWGSQVAK